MEVDHSHQIVRTKLAPPRLAGATQRREDLLASLEERRNKRLTIIVGPAGSGKSTLAALWRQELLACGREVCWYNLGRDDTDTAQFAAYLIATLQHLSPQFGVGALTLYSRSGGHSHTAFIGALVNDLLDLEEPFHLVLEDFHAVAGSDVLALIQQLIDHAPPMLRIVITARTRPALNYLRLRVADELNEVSFSDLRFSLSESMAFLRGQRLEGLGPSQMHRLHSLADGWPAALQMFAYSLRKSRNPGLYIERLSGPLTPDKEASLTDYLNEFVSPLLSAREMEFLVRTSACRRFNSDLCEVVTGDPQARQILQRFVDDSLFVIPIDYDDERQWYRLHMTFAKFLGDRLLKLPKEELDRINRNASQWFARYGLHVEAIRHALYADDQAACIEQLERAARGMVGSSQSLQLLKWFGQLPQDAIRDRTELLLCVAWASVACGRRETLGWCVAEIERLSEARTSAVAFELVLLKASQLMRQDDTASALVLLEPYLSAPPAGSRFLEYQLNAQASHALVYADEFERMREFARRCWQVYGNRCMNTPIVDALVGFSYLRQGDAREAKAVLGVSLKQVALSRKIGDDAMAYLAAYLADAHYQLDEPEAAAGLLAQHGSLIEAIGPQDVVLSASGVAIRLHRLRGEMDSALEIVREVEARGAQQGLDRMICWSLCEKIQLQLARGQLPLAQESLRRLENIAQPYLAARRCAHADIPGYLSLARINLHMACGDLDDALRELGALVIVIESRGHMLTLCRLRVKQAEIESRRHNGDAAKAALRSALSLAVLYGLPRVLIDGGESIEPLLSTLADDVSLSAPERELAQRCASRIESLREVALTTAGAGSTTRAVQPAAGLSAKELEIVDLLAKAFSNKSIARALNISPGTVKWHLKSVYSKLGAASRENAVIKARSLHIVD